MVQLIFFLFHAVCAKGQFFCNAPTCDPPQCDECPVDTFKHNMTLGEHCTACPVLANTNGQAGQESNTCGK